MGKCFDAVTSEIQDWVAQQRLFFVATAPLSADGLINCSPKGMDTFRIIGPTEVAYLDLTGSGIETAAHLAENRRIVFMFCAFSGPPRIMRMHGAGAYHRPGSPAFAEVIGLFPELPGIRGIVRASLTRISDSCGFAVPRYDFVEERDTLVKWAESKGTEGLRQYQRTRNERSIDGLPGLPEDNGAGTSPNEG
ncbi:MAG: pyridoxamine 5'-phosphate oxidase family protein [Spongiibacteraceae bacterium]|jgi:hypothetical protein|nr:pyridoxamine 5'-phosphate oxidase family protein [Spongiibacteraceae bacterium]